MPLLLNEATRCIVLMIALTESPSGVISVLVPRDVMGRELCAPSPPVTHLKPPFLFAPPLHLHSHHPPPPLPTRLLHACCATMCACTLAPKPSPAPRPPFRCPSNSYLASCVPCRKATTTYNLLRNRGKDKYRANKLMASKILTLEQHLDYEAIIQIAEIEDQDLLYLNFDNQALGEG